MKVYKTIVVDDEQISIKSITKTIQKSQLSVEIVGTFLSSQEALAYMQENPIDLLITDINMPEYSGLDLLRRIHEIDSSVGVIIITGFGSLDYAREAMTYGVKYFLQKPFTPSELIESIQKSIPRIEEKRGVALLQRKELIKNQIFGEELSETFSQSFSMLSYPESSFPSFHSAYDDWFQINRYEYVYSIIKGTVLYFIFEEGASPLTIPDSLKQERGIIVLQQGVKLRGAKTAFDQASPFYEKVFYFKELKCFSDQDLVKNSQNLPIAAILEEFSKLLVENNYLSLERKIHELFTEVGVTLPSVHQLKRCSKEVAKLLIEDGKLGMTDGDLVQLFDQADHYQQLEERLVKLLGHAKAQKESDLAGKSISDNINLILENHFQISDLSLKWISKNKLFLNPEYIGKVYLKETGKKFTARLLEVRMERAADLLNQGFRGYEVAKMVGYENNPDYFGQQFRKYHGVTPRQYLKK